MNNLKDLILVVISLFFWSSSFFSQTYIGPTVGYDFQKVITTPIDIYRIDFRKKGFGYNSPLIGINFKQKLYKQFYAQFSSDYTYKHVRGFFYGGFTEDLLFHYSYLKNQLLTTYYFKTIWKVGAGLTYNLVTNLYYEDKESDYTSNQRFNYSEKGWVFKFGMKYKNVEIEAIYHGRLGTPTEGDGIHGYHYHQIQSLGLRVSYDFMIFDACKKKEKPELAPENKMAVVE
ncbi:MAG: hypothetical protein IPM34_01135 [Saprospiraceae bacterium]|nr:hypothetical protein [Saprospiraceae bacterium]